MAYQDRVVIGDCTLYCGEAAEILATLDVSQAVLITDPPYQVQSGGNWFAKRRSTYRTIADTLSTGCDYACLSLFPRWVVFCNKDQLPQLLMAAWQREAWALLTWNKINPSPLMYNNYLPDVEYIVHTYPTGALFGTYEDRRKYFLSGVNDWPRYSTHPTEKPLALLRKLVRNATQPGELVVDPYAGSFTTAHACLQLGRACIAIERVRSYWEAGCRRIEQAYTQPALLPVASAASVQQQLFATSES